MTEHLLRHHDICSFTVLCRKQQGDGAFFCIMQELFYKLLLGSQFTNVTVPEFPSFRLIMAEPAAQPVARCDVPKPFIDMQIFLSYPHNWSTNIRFPSSGAGRSLTRFILT
jgi:hypothetical protein